MAAFAGKRGSEATNFLGALAAGGQDFSESNIKTAARFNELREKMEDRKYALAQADEALKLGDITRGSAQYKDATTQFRKAQEDLSKHEGDMIRDEKTAARRMQEIELQGRYQLAAAAATREDRNTAVKKLSDAYVRAQGNPKAQAEIKRQLEELTSATGTGFGAVIKAGTAEQARRKEFIAKNPMLLMELNAATRSGDPNKIQAATIAIQQAAKFAGVDLSDMAGGGASANRLTTGADGILTYNPQPPIE
jgi:hypothetical protein